MLVYLVTMVVGEGIKHHSTHVSLKVLGWQLSSCRFLNVHELVKRHELSCQPNTFQQPLLFRELRISNCRYQLRAW